MAEKKTTPKATKNATKQRKAYNAPKGYKPKIVKPSEKNRKRYNETMIID